MATRQTNRKTTTKKRTTKKKGGSGIFVAVGAVGLLLALIIASLYFLVDGNSETVSYIKTEDKKEVSNIDKEKELKNAEREKLEKLKKQQQEQARLEKEQLDKIRKEQSLKAQELADRENRLKEEELNIRENRIKEERLREEQLRKEKDQNERLKQAKLKEDRDKNKNVPVYVVNIDDEIKNVLFDNEISKSSVKKGSFTKQNKVYTTLDVKCHKDAAYILNKALEALFIENGYETKTESKQGKNIIYARNNKDNYIVTIKDVSQVVEKSVSKESKKNTVASNLPKPPTKANKTVKIGILLDDGGNSLEVGKQYAKLNYPVAIAILPHLEHSKEVAKISKNAGKTVYLHFPMAPKSYPKSDPGEGAITPTMPTLLIKGIADKNFKSLGVKLDGFNNHMGSAITEDAVKMREVFKVSKVYTTNFIDSRTTPNSVAYKECKSAGYKCAENKAFLDNDNDINAIITKLYEAAEKAKKTGSVVVIGHIRTNTVKALEIAIPELEKRNYKIVNLNTLLH